MNIRTLMLLLLATTGTVLGNSALASPGHGHPGHRGYHQGGGIYFHSRPQYRPHYQRPHYRHYRYHDDWRWRGGHWARTWHDGRFGWWWWTGGTWLLYSTPVYPYPDAYQEPLYIVEDPLDESQPDSDDTASPPARYYCDSPRGWYPAIPACPSGWQTVPVPPADEPGER